MKPMLYVHPFSAFCQKVLIARPSFTPAVDEGRPYRHIFPPGAPDRD